MGVLLEKVQRVDFWATLPSMDVADVYDMDFRRRGIHHLCKRKHPSVESLLADQDSRLSLAMYRQVSKMLEALGPLRPSKLVCLFHTSLLKQLQAMSGYRIRNVDQAKFVAKACRKIVAKFKSRTRPRRAHLIQRLIHSQDE